MAGRLRNVSRCSRCPGVSAFSLFEERALRADVRRYAHDAALAHEELQEKNPRLRALEKASEELADLKAAAMTSAAHLADEKARFRKQDQELQRLRGQLRAAEKQVEYFKSKDSEEASDPKREALAEELRAAKAEAARFKERTRGAAEKDPAADLRKRVAGLERELASADSGREALVDDFRAAKADVFRIKGVLEQAQVALRSRRLQIDGLQTRPAELEKELETRSKVTVRDYNRLVDDKLLLKEEVRLLREEMEKLHLSIAARPAEQVELAHSGR
ncbi:MAG: hypothetical protein M1826_000313 [Phylliscum demangeonii]|nr:MAG: hypothetical protein M1826_000313 [Phylliscum demangeonii]